MAISGNGALHDYLAYQYGEISELVNRSFPDPIFYLENHLRNRA